MKQNGFTILEVFIAFGLFAGFAAVFLQSQSQNVFDSQEMGQEVILKQLCEGKISELMINPPDLTTGSDGKKETKKFDIDDYEHYSYTIELKKFEAPDLESLFSSGSTEDQSSEEKAQLQVLKTVLQKVKDKIEEIFWQVRVTVTNTEDQRSYELSTWFTDPKAKYDIDIPLLKASAPKKSEDEE